MIRMYVCMYRIHTHTHTHHTYTCIHTPHTHTHPSRLACAMQQRQCPGPRPLTTTFFFVPSDAFTCTRTRSARDSACCCGCCCCCCSGGGGMRGGGGRSQRSGSSIIGGTFVRLICGFGGICGECRRRVQLPICLFPALVRVRYGVRALKCLLRCFAARAALHHLGKRAAFV